MIRALVTATFVVALVVSGCGPPRARPGVGKTGGSGGAAGETGGTGGAGAAQVAGGSGGATAGSGGSAGSGGAGDAAAPVDRPPAPADAPLAPDGGAADATAGDGGAELGGDPVANKPWLRLCPKAWNQMQCCELLCACLDRLCADSPMDKARVPGCMSMCTKLADFRARCQAYHCFESKNPGATKDHVSHCGHASGRVGGGSCTIIQQQQ